MTVTPRGVDRLRSGHLWIYRSDVARIDADPGDVVAVSGPRGRPLGYALYSDKSQISLRMVAKPEEKVGRDFWRARIATAVRFRERLQLDATACRLVHAEGDLLPSLVVDRYGDYLVLQTLSQTADRLLPLWTEILVDLLKPAGILARNDVRVRLLEGLETHVQLLHGEVPKTIPAREGRVEYEVDPWAGQKTGLFLDQRENREAAARYAHGRLLDCFSYNGGFALALAPHCDQVTAIDSSEEAAGHIRENAARNGFPDVEVRVANVFDELREMDRGDERFDTIVLDPPAFAKNRASLPKALAGYKEINLRALRLLKPGGVLVTCTCSHHVDEATFGEVVFDAALDAQVSVSMVEKRMQGRDHPVLLGVPETYYLKCFILRKL